MHSALGDFETAFLKFLSLKALGNIMFFSVALVYQVFYERAYPDGAQSELAYFVESSSGENAIVPCDVIEYNRGMVA